MADQEGDWIVVIDELRHRQIMRRRIVNAIAVHMMGRGESWDLRYVDEADGITSMAFESENVTCRITVTVRKDDE